MILFFCFLMIFIICESQIRQTFSITFTVSQKGSNLWIKVGTIRHRSRWYVYGNPPRGMKLGDDAEEIDLDVTLEKFDLTKRFLIRILEQFAKESGLKLDEFLTDGAKDRLVLASGGVARDFLTIFRRAIDVARERLARGVYVSR